MLLPLYICMYVITSQSWIQVQGCYPQETMCHVQVYAYTTSQLQTAILRLFTRCECILPNLFVGVLTRESTVGALASGLSADQIVGYLRQHAHPHVASRSPAVPEVRRSARSNMAALCRKHGFLVSWGTPDSVLIILRQHAHLHVASRSPNVPEVRCFPRFKLCPAYHSACPVACPLRHCSYSGRRILVSWGTPYSYFYASTLPATLPGAPLWCQRSDALLSIVAALSLADHRACLAACPLRHRACSGRGILMSWGTPDSILIFLRQHAHPHIASRSPVVPEICALPAQTMAALCPADHHACSLACLLRHCAYSGDTVPMGGCTPGSTLVCVRQHAHLGVASRFSMVPEVCILPSEGSLLRPSRQPRC